MQNKIWFVTGSSSGFGRVWTEAALQRGDTVVATARDPSSLDELGTPGATTEAVLRLVDSDDPPARLILGNVFPAIEAIYEERLQTWRAWQDVSLAAFGEAVASGT